MVKNPKGALFTQIARDFINIYYQIVQSCFGALFSQIVVNKSEGKSKTSDHKFDCKESQRNKFRLQSIC